MIVNLVIIVWAHILVYIGLAIVNELLGKIIASFVGGVCDGDTNVLTNKADHRQSSTTTSTY